MKLCLVLVALADDVHVFGRISPGMALEIQEPSSPGTRVVGDWEFHEI